MTADEVKLERFTAFEDLTVEFSPGINAFVGANGTGKTHLMKVCYAACDVSKTGGTFGKSCFGYSFLQDAVQADWSNKRRKKAQGTAKVHSGERSLSATFSNTEIFVGSVKVGDVDPWAGSPIASVYIPPKEMLANAPGFLSLYAAREVHFEEVYRDILHRAYLPPLRGPLPAPRQRLLDKLEKTIGGQIVVEGEEFFLSGQQGKIEFTLLAEGWRKLGLLWLLIRNGSLPEGSVLFWDEPEDQPEPEDVPGGDRGAAGVAAGGGAGVLRHARLRDPEGAGPADDGGGRKWRSTRCIGPRTMRSRAIRRGGTWTSLPTRLMRLLTTFTTG